MRLVLQSGGVLVALVAVVAGVTFLVSGAPSGPTLFLLDAAQAGIALAVVVAVRGPLHRHPDGLAMLFLVGVPIVPLGTLAVQPDLRLLVGASLTLIPGAVALLVPWRGRFFALWAAAFVAIVVLGSVVLVQGSMLPLVRALELNAVVSIGIAFAVLGWRIRHRQDILGAEREFLHRELSLQARRQAAVLQQLNAELVRVARADALTGAGNRLRLEEDMFALTDRLRRYGQGLSLVLFDIDRFKEFNDRYGHVAGDEALRRVVASMRQGLRAGDLVYRYGGEELLVVLPEQQSTGAVGVAERLRTTLMDAAIPHADDPPWSVLTVSAGVAAVLPGTTSTWDAWVDRADRALYAAKAAGRNRSKLAADDSATAA